MNKIQKVCDKLRTGYHTKSNVEDEGKAEKSIKFSEESNRTIHELGNIELHESGQISRTVQCQSYLKHIPEGLIFSSCGICLRLDEEQIQRIKARFEAFTVPYYFARVNCSRGEQKTRRSSMAKKKTLESNRCPKRSKKEQARFHRAQVAERRKVSRISESSWMDRRLLPIHRLPHDDRHLQQRNLAPAKPVRKHHLTDIQ